MALPPFWFSMEHCWTGSLLTRWRATASYLSDSVVEVAQHLVDLLRVPHSRLEHTVVAALALLSVELELDMTLAVLRVEPVPEHHAAFHRRPAVSAGLENEK